MYDKAAPIPGIMPSPGRNTFLRLVMEAVTEAAEQCDIILRKDTPLLRFFCASYLATGMAPGTSRQRRMSVTHVPPIGRPIILLSSL